MCKKLKRQILIKLTRKTGYTIKITFFVTLNHLTIIRNLFIKIHINKKTHDNSITYLSKYLLAINCLKYERSLNNTHKTLTIETFKLKHRQRDTKLYSLI